MFNGELITELNEHSQYARLTFMVDGVEVRLSDLESEVRNDCENIILNLRSVE